MARISGSKKCGAAVLARTRFESRYYRVAGMPAPVLCRIRRAPIPIRRARIVCEDPRAASIKPLGDHAKAGDEVATIEVAILHDIIDFLSQGPGIELRLQPRHPPKWPFEHSRGQFKIEFLDLRRAVAKRQSARDDRAGRGAADQIEIITAGGFRRAVSALRLFLLDDLFDPLQETTAIAPRTPPPSSDRIRLVRAEQVAVASRPRVWVSRQGQLVHSAACVRAAGATGK